MDSEKCIQRTHIKHSLSFTPECGRLRACNLCVASIDTSASHPTSSHGRRLNISPNKILSVEMCILYILFALVYHSTHSSAYCTLYALETEGCNFCPFAHQQKHSSTNLTEKNEFVRGQWNLYNRRMCESAICSFVHENREVFSNFSPLVMMFLVCRLSCGKV